MVHSMPQQTQRNERMERTELGNGIHFTAIHDERFKQNQISLNFLLPLRRETATLYALLPLMLRRGCREFPDMTALNRRLKELYGAHIDGSTGKRGEVQIVTLYCDSLSNGYAFGGEDVLAQCAALLRAVAFEPALENGVFRAADMAVEKRNLSDMIEAQLNEKRQYATMRLREEMCRGEAYGVSELGRREDVAGITAEALVRAWKDMLERSRVEIFLVGPGEPSGVRDSFASAFANAAFANAAFENAGRGEPYDIQTQVVKTAGEPRTVVERLPVAQSKLVMGLRAGVAAPENTDAMQLACAILGGTPQSKFFLNVREKKSLCYYCLSYYERYKGLVFFDSGIEEKNFDAAREEMLLQLKLLQNGDFTDDEMRFAKLSLRNALTQVNDSLEAMSVYYLGQALAGTFRTAGEAADAIDAVSREEAAAAAKGIALDTVYLLAGEQAAEGETSLQ